MGVVVSYLKLGANCRSAVLWTTLDGVLSSPGVHSLKEIIHKIQPERTGEYEQMPQRGQLYNYIQTHTHTCSPWVSWEYHLWKCLCSSQGFLWHHTQPADKKQDVNLRHETRNADVDHIFSPSFSSIYNNTWDLWYTTGEHTTKWYLKLCPPSCKNVHFITKSHF